MDPHLENHPPEESESERPLECSECHKPIEVIYKELIGKSLTCTAMCNSCPELQRRLHGAKGDEIETFTGVSNTGLVCGNCGTTLDSVKIAHQLGCSECYEVFKDVIMANILSSRKINGRSKTGSPLVHMGRSPGEIQELNPALKLLALTEALNETLKVEDYEQAALLRDQIKKLTERSEGKNGN